MASIKWAYGTGGVALTCTVASLTDGSARESTAVDNTTNLYLDALVMAKFTTSTGTISNPKTVFLYVYGTNDGGTTYPDNVTGSDAAITLDSPTQLKLLGAVYCTAVSTAYIGGPWSVAACFGGKLPGKWGIVALNDTGVSLSATGGDHAITYQGVYGTSA